MRPRTGFSSQPSAWRPAQRVLPSQEPSAFRDRIGGKEFGRDLCRRLSPIVASYDLSPDGKTAALLVMAGSNVGAPFWLITQDLVSNHWISEVDLGASVFPASGFPLQVLYASDKHYLVVQDLRQIRVFDAHSLRLVRTIPASSTRPSQGPLFALAASKSNVVVCAFGTAVPPEFGVHTTPAHLEMVDVVSGKVLSESSAFRLTGSSSLTPRHRVSISAFVLHGTANSRQESTSA